MRGEITEGPDVNGDYTFTLFWMGWRGPQTKEIHGKPQHHYNVFFWADKRDDQTIHPPVRVGWQKFRLDDG